MWFIYDACGIGCCIATYCIMTFVSSLVVKVSVVPLAKEGYLSGFICVCVYLILLGLAAASHIRCMISDPGAIPKDSVQVDFEDSERIPKQICVKCKCYKPARAHHCSICKRCITKMDHHCPWVNNCVGFYTQKHFVLFLFYIMAACLYSFLLLATRAAYCRSHLDAKLCQRSKEETALDMLLGMAAFFVGVIFFLFVCAMLNDQLCCIVSGVSGIEMLKKEVVEKRSAKENLEETFGGKFGIAWFLPIGIKMRVEKNVEV